MKSSQKYFSTCLLGIAALLGGASTAWAQTAPALGTAASFGVLSGGGVGDAVKTVTCTDSTVIGDVGGPFAAASPTRCTFLGQTAPDTDAAAVGARTALTSAYNIIRNGGCTDLTQTNTGTTVGRNISTLSGVTLAPGTYCLDDVAKTGVLTLTGNGPWIFKVIQTAAGDLTGTNFTVNMAAGNAQACNVFWAPATAATMTDSALKGNILAGNASVGSITLTRGTLAGRALANVAVTMTGASVIGCAAVSASMACKAGERLVCKKKHGHHGGKDDDDDDDDDDGDKRHKQHKNNKNHQNSPFKSWYNRG
jgi:hypothetical protein